MNTEQAIQRWNQYAERYTATYDEQGDNHRVVLLNPTIFSLLEGLDGKHVLDAGCGKRYLKYYSNKFSISSSSTIKMR